MRIYISKTQIQKPCIDITKDVIIGPSSWERHLEAKAKEEQQKRLPTCIKKKTKNRITKKKIKKSVKTIDKKNNK